MSLLNNYVIIFDGEIMFKKLNKIAINLINKYQKTTKNNKKRCRYTPSCSEYSKECYMTFNFIKASLLTLFRLLRCNPLFKGGYDPIPLTREEKQKIKASLPEAVINDKFNPFNVYYKIRYKK